MPTLPAQGGRRVPVVSDRGGMLGGGHGQPVLQGRLANPVRARRERQRHPRARVSVQRVRETGVLQRLRMPAPQ